MSPLTKRLAAFALASSVLATGVLGLLGEPSVWQEVSHFASARQGVDSWRPMNQARAYLAQDPDTPLYAWLFFEQRIKFIYPPTSLLLLDLMPREGMRAALNALSWVCVLLAAVFSALVLDRALAGPSPPHGAADRAARFAVALLLALTFHPLLKAYSLGQMQVVVNALFAAAVWCWIGDRRAVAGVLVALMAAVKPQYALIGLWGILRGERRFVVAAAGSGLVLLAISVLRFGLEHHVDYLSVVAHVGRHGEAYWPNQTVNGFLHRLLGNGVSSHWDPHVYPPRHALVQAGSLVASVVLLGIAFFGPVRDAARGGGLDFAAAALATTLASPIAWEHHYGVMLPMFALVLPAALERGSPRRIVGLAVAWAVAAHYLDVLRRIDGTAWNPLQSLLLFAALFVLGWLVALRSGAPSRASVRHP